MHEEEFDGDVTLQLPKGMSILTPERKRMLGYEPDEEVTHAEIRSKNLMEFMGEKRIIDDQELFDGKTFQIWRSQNTRMFRNEIDPYDPLSEKPRGENFGEVGYIMIAKRLNRTDYEIIVDAIDTDCVNTRARMAYLLKEDPETHLAAHRSLGNTYQRSFARLVHIMADVRKTIDAMKKAANDKIDA